MGLLFEIKQRTLGVLYSIDQMLPKRLGICIRNRFAPWRKPILDVVEIHLTDHCNLNCVGCLHFTPLAKKWFADAQVVKRDLKALREKFRYIRHVTLLGGEPLLHPEYEKFVAVVKEVSPESLVTIVTNGVMLKGDVLDRFLRVCAENRVRVKWTVYPPIEHRREELVRAFKDARVEMFMVDVGDFYVKMLPDGGNPKSALRLCRNSTYCPYLRDGRLYTCAQAYHIRDYIAAWKRETGEESKMRPSKGLDVHDSKLDGWAALEYLMTPCETCRFCADSLRFVKWGHCTGSVKEWIR